MRILTLLLLWMPIFCLAQTPNVADAPAGTQNGINYISATSVVLQLEAPNKGFAYALGEWNNWNVNATSLMNRTLDGNRHWIQVDNLTPGQKYAYQYRVGSPAIYIADPNASEILDPWNDQYIGADRYPSLKAYPTGQNNPVSVLQTAQVPFAWNEGGFVAPEKHKLTIYELLIRDFEDPSTFHSVTERLDYLENLGINAIELLPIIEFDGNNSWGYNPNFNFATDKFYGTQKALKQLINACHQRGIAVILDIALNHSFGLNPQVRLYANGNEPAGGNPWFNSIATHPFSIGADYNHQSQLTRDYCKNVFSHWLKEFHIDGFRLDLSKGFTQNNSLGNVGAWNNYDQSRIEILQDYKNHINTINGDAYVILEHFADNDEEIELANRGFLLWGPAHYDFNQAVLGYNSNLGAASWQERGWPAPSLVSFMESHDEERLMYEAQQYGNANGGYDVKNTATALDRMEAAFAFFLGIPGPKMMWQFGEVGYDYSINHCPDGSINSSCRTAEKPIRWDYLEDENRRKLYKTVAAMNNLRNTSNALHTYEYTMDAGGTGKRLWLNHAEMNLSITANFDVSGFDMSPDFQHTGTWYNYFTGEAVQVDNANMTFYYNPGDFLVFTDVQLALPDVNGATAIGGNIAGCTDGNAVNYDAASDTNDGSCLYNLTFRVDLGATPAAANDVHIGGSFQGWNPASTVMVNTTDNVWEYTIAIGGNELVEYKFINGAGWAVGETVLADCGNSDGFGGYNRALLTGFDNEVLPLLCFGECGPCEIGDVSVSFAVDMNNENVSAEGIFVTGDWQSEAGLGADWAPNTAQLLDGNGDGIYTATFDLPQGMTFEYLFLNGDDFSRSEDANLFQNCGTTNGLGGYNRILYTGNIAINELLVVCFNSCEACPEGPTFVDVTFAVDMTNETVPPLGVHLAGSFQGWDPSATPLNYDGNGIWSMTLAIEENQTIEYKFINGNAWGMDESVPSACATGFNRSIAIGTIDLSLPINCFGSCDACLPPADILGCTDPLANNYDSAATLDDGSCLFLNGSAFCGLGTVWDATVSLCVPTANDCGADLDGNGIVNIGDLLSLVGFLGVDCE